MTAPLSAERVALALRLRARGMSLREAGRQVCCNQAAVHQLERGERRRVPRPYGWQPGPGRLSVADREEISLGAGGRGVVQRDRGPAGAGGLDGVAGGRRERRPGGLPGLAGA